MLREVRKMKKEECPISYLGHAFGEGYIFSHQNSAIWL